MAPVFGSIQAPTENQARLTLHRTLGRRVRPKRSICWLEKLRVRHPYHAGDIFCTVHCHYISWDPGVRRACSAQFKEHGLTCALTCKKSLGFLISMRLQWSHRVWSNRVAKNAQKNRILGQIYLYLSLALVISDFRQTSFSPQSLQQCLSPHPLLEPGSPSIFPPG